MANTGNPFGLRKGLIAPWTAQGAWGTAIQVEALRTFNMRLDTVSGRLEGDDVRSALAAVPVGGSGQLQFGFKSLALLATLVGLNEVTSAGSDVLTFTWQPFPYFGIAIQVYQEDATGAYDLFIPKCKLMGNLSFNPQYGQFWSQTVDAEFIDDGGVYGFAKIIARTTASVLAIPPA